MDVRLLASYKKELKDKVAALTEALISGSPKDVGEFKQLCGEINGLRFAQTHLEDLLKRLEQEDD
jgi:hypothetical protein